MKSKFILGLSRWLWLSMSLNQKRCLILEGRPYKYKYYICMYVVYLLAGDYSQVVVLRLKPFTKVIPQMSFWFNQFLLVPLSYFPCARKQTSDDTGNSYYYVLVMILFWYPFTSYITHHILTSSNQFSTNQTSSGKKESFIYI